MNAIVHARAGEALISRGVPGGCVQIRIEDHGAGITLENIPNAALRKGFTTAGTMWKGGDSGGPVLQSYGTYFVALGINNVRLA